MAAAATAWHAARVYRTRPIRFLRLEGAVKVYGIAADAELPRPELVDAAVAALPNVLAGDGPGFLIVHDAADHCFALVNWWANENEVHQRILTAPLDDPTVLRPLETPAIGCVWELEVVDFERRAWLAHVLARAAGPDLAGYLAARFDGRV
jgi:hypothetical protein